MVNIVNSVVFSSFGREWEEATDAEVHTDLLRAKEPGN